MVYIADIIVERDTLRAENERLREALRFYANENVYRPDSIGRYPDLIHVARRALHVAPDGGNAARDAARYRWLRMHPQWLGWDADFRPDEVDREIDAAMEAANGR